VTGWGRKAPALCLAALLVAVNAWAVPFVPSDDSAVLERLPDTSRALRRQQAALAADPGNQALALQVAEADIGRARAMGDPRYLGRAEAALAPWPAGPAAPAAVMLLRAVILQSNHDFRASLAALDQVLRQQPGNAQAWLTRASIRQAQADYPGALADCGQVATLVLGLAPDVCTAGAMALRGQAPLALRAITLSLSVNAQEAARTPSVALWALTLAAEIAERLDDPSTEMRFKKALAVDPSDPYLLGAWSDWLLDHGRPREVVGLLADKTRIDPLLLRLALAEQALGESAADGHVADLAARFEASRLRGDTVHRREEARFALWLQHDPGRAVTLAAANFVVQREPSDARILLEASIAAAQPGAAEPVLAWLSANRVQDNRLASLANRLRAKS
jgi:tetratricopeptide (TPR) repeat protein